MENLVSIFLVVLFTFGLTYAQENTESSKPPAGQPIVQREKSALLEGDEARALTKQCSRDSPSDFTDTWMPTPEVILEMENRFDHISELKAECCIRGARIENPNDWYMQYAALIWRGKKIIYINAIGRNKPAAFSADENWILSESSERWKISAVIVCDGGEAYWGVIYNTETRKFSDLAVNGVA